MADTQQGVRQQSARDAAGTTDTYDGDLRALFESVATVPAGSTYNEAFMLWLQSVTGSSADNINDLAALYASQQDDTYNWSSSGSLSSPTIPDLGTLIYWFDAQVAASITETGTGVSNWADQSGNGYDVSQGVDADRPSFTTDGSNPALLFNGTSDFLQADSLGLSLVQKTCFFVARHLDRLSVGRPVQTSDNVGAQVFTFIFFTTSIRSVHSSSAGSTASITLTNSDTLIHAGVARQDDTIQAEFEIDDGTSGSDAGVGTLLAALDKIDIGRNPDVSNFFNGYIMEVGAYEELLSDSAKSTLLTILKTKWGL